MSYNSRTRRVSSKLTASLLLIAATGTHAQQIAVFSFHDASCGAWIKASRDEEEREPYLHWIRGFVSGYNAAKEGRTVPLRAMPNQETLALYLDKYCRENPLHEFYAAAFALVREVSVPVPPKMTNQPRP